MKSWLVIKKESLKKRVSAAVIAAVLVFSLFLKPAVSASVFDYTGNWTPEAVAGSCTGYPGTALYYEEGVTENQLAEAVMAWNLIPEDIKESIISSGCRIYISSSVVFYGNVYGYYHGVTIAYNLSTNEITRVTGTPYIVISSTAPDFTGVILHEVGHLTDSTIKLLNSRYWKGDGNAISSSTEWQALYAEYASVMYGIDTMTKSNMMVSAEEGWAEAFRLAYEKPDVFAVICPEIYNFVINYSM